MKVVASGRLLPEINSLIMRSTSKEMTIGGEGEPPGPTAVHGIQEKFGISGVPYQNRRVVGVPFRVLGVLYRNLRVLGVPYRNLRVLEDEGKPGKGGKEQTFS